MIRYNLYPSLLDAYVYMSAAEDEEQAGQRLADFLATLNRVPSETSEAAARGTALNNIIDYFLSGAIANDCPTYTDSEEQYTFTFDGDLVRNLATILAGSVAQCFTSATIATSLGDVRLYGYPDYVCGDTVYDLKTTASEYHHGKYRDKWQSRVYPYCLVKSMQVADCAEFIYLVAELHPDRKSGVIGGQVYREFYNPTFEQCEREIRLFLDTEFLPFIELHRSEINNPKLFGNGQEHKRDND